MAMTPEARVKNQVKKILAEYKPLYGWWPVPNGMGASSLDFVGCFRGVFFAVETKAPGKKPTARQDLCIQEMRAAGGIVFVIDGEEGYTALRKFMNFLAAKDANFSQPEAQDGGRAVAPAGSGPVS